VFCLSHRLSILLVPVCPVKIRPFLLPLGLHVDSSRVEESWRWWTVWWVGGMMVCGGGKWGVGWVEGGERREEKGRGDRAVGVREGCVLYKLELEL
jgi:hypothetical protein